MTSELGRLVTEHMDAQKYRPSQAQIADAVGVSRQIVSKWMAGTAGLPHADNLRALARTLGVPYQRVLEAALVDAGYYPPAPPKERDGDDGSAAPTSQGAREPARLITPVAARKQPTGSSRPQPDTRRARSQD